MQGWENFSLQGPETLLLCRGRLKELEIPVLVLNSILYIVGGATQQQGSHIKLRATQLQKID